MVDSASSNKEDSRPMADLSKEQSSEWVQGVKSSGNTASASNRPNEDESSAPASRHRSPSPEGSPYTSAVAVGDSMRPLSSQPELSEASAVSSEKHTQQYSSSSNSDPSTGLSGHLTSQEKEGQRKDQQQQQPHHHRHRRQSISSESSASSFSSSSSSGSTCCQHSHHRHHHHQPHEHEHHRRPLSFSRVFVSAAINLVIPFINGVMLGWGEIFANELGFRWGWIGATVYPRSRSEGRLTLISRNTRLVEK